VGGEVLERQADQGSSPAQPAVVGRGGWQVGNRWPSRWPANRSQCRSES
jgi:hypothetical protein